MLVATQTEWPEFILVAVFQRGTERAGHPVDVIVVTQTEWPEFILVSVFRRGAERAGHPVDVSCYTYRMPRVHPSCCVFQ